MRRRHLAAEAVVNLSGKYGPLRLVLALRERELELEHREGEAGDLVRGDAFRGVPVPAQERRLLARVVVEGVEPVRKSTGVSSAH